MCSVTEFWLREAAVSTSGKVFTYPNFEIQFKMEFGKGGDPDFATVEIYNLMPESEALFQLDEMLTLEAGYAGDVGILMLGKIRHVQVFREGNDRICEIEVYDTSSEYQGDAISESYVPGTTAEQILQRIIVNKSGLELGKISLPKNLVYAQGRSVDGTPRDIITEIAEDCGAEVHIVHGMIYVLPPGGWRDETVILSASSGLIDSPKKVEEEDSNVLWEVESLLNYRIRPGTLVQIDSKQVPIANGVYAVESGTHVSSGSEFKTVIKLKLPEA